MPDSTPIIQGAENTRFGTSNILQDESLANAIVVSARFTDHGDSVEEPGNTGHTKTTVDLDDGWDAEIVCIDDADITWPGKGDVMSILRPGTGAAVNADVVRVNNEYDRKATGRITFSVRYRPDRAIVAPGP